MSDTSTGAKSLALNNKFYDTLKWIALVALPAAGALYFGLSEIWDLPYAIEIVGSITVVDTALGGLLGASSRSYNHSDAKYDGAIVVDTSDPQKDVVSLNMDRPIDEVLNEVQSVTLKIENPPRLKDSQ